MDELQEVGAARSHLTPAGVRVYPPFTYGFPYFSRVWPMQLLAPDILSEARELSLPLVLTGLGVGLMIWLLGWQAHRFWLVLVTTVGAGVFGLYSGPANGTQPLVAGVL